LTVIFLLSYIPIVVIYEKRIMPPICRVALVTVALIAWASAAFGAPSAPCVPPPGFVDTPHPAVAPVEQLVSHTEEITINRPLDAVLDSEGKVSLEKAIDRGSSLPGVSGTYMLTKGIFGQPGSRRLTCLTDGSTLVEEVLENARSAASSQFRYVVWNYTSEKAYPIVYGVGHFVRTDLSDGRTQVRWAYSFQLNRSRFPGFLGSVGDWLFRKNFLDRQYGDMMRGTLAASKSRVNSETSVGVSSPHIR
jgi:hypothetical protein